MFEPLDIDRRADEALAEIRRMADAALREIDRMLGYTETFTRRSIGQRRRWARGRATKELL